MTKLLDNLEKEKQKALKSFHNIENLQKLAFKYPEASIIELKPDKTLVLSSKQAKINECDNPVTVQPFVTFHKVRIYSHPFRFVIGYKSYNDYFVPDKDWKQKMIDNKISQTVIDKVDKFVKEKKQEEIADAFENLTTNDIKEYLKERFTPEEMKEYIDQLNND